MGWRRGVGGKDFLVDYISHILTPEGFAAFTLRGGKGGLKSDRAREVLSKWAEGLNGLSRRDAGLNNNDGSPLIQPDVVTLSGITPSDKKPLITESSVKRSWLGSDPVVLSEDEEKSIIGWRRGVGEKDFLADYIKHILDPVMYAKFIIRDGNGRLKSLVAWAVVRRWAAGMKGQNDDERFPLTEPDVVRLSGTTSDDRKPLIGEHAVRSSWAGSDPMSLSEEQEESIIGWRRGVDEKDFLADYIEHILDPVMYAKFIIRDRTGGLKSGRAREVLSRWARGLNGLSRRQAGLDGVSGNDGSPLTGPDVVELSGKTPDGTSPDDKKDLISRSAVKKWWTGTDPVVLSENQEKSIVGWRRGVGGKDFLVDYIEHILSPDMFAKFILRNGAGRLKSPVAWAVVCRWAAGLNGLLRCEAGLYGKNGTDAFRLTIADVARLSGMTSGKKPLIGEISVKDLWDRADPVLLSDEEEESIAGWRRGDDGSGTLVEHIEKILGEVRFAVFTLRDEDGVLKSRVARDVVWRWAARLNGKHDTDESRFTAPVVAALSGTTLNDEALISEDTVDTTWSADPVRLSEYEEESIVGWRRGDDGPDTLVGHIKNLLSKERFAVFTLRNIKLKHALKSWVARDVVWRWAAGMNGENDHKGSPLTQLAVAELSGKPPSDARTLISENMVKKSWIRADPVRLSEDQEESIIRWRRGDDGKDFLVDHIKDILDPVMFAKFIIRDRTGGLRSGMARDVVWRWAAGLNGENGNDGSPLTADDVAALSGKPPSDDKTLISRDIFYKAWVRVKRREVDVGRGDHPVSSGSEPGLHPASAPVGAEEPASWSGPSQTPMFPVGTYGDPSADQLMMDAVDGPSEPGADPGMDPRPDGQDTDAFFSVPAELAGGLASEVLTGNHPTGNHQNNDYLKDDYLIGDGSAGDGLSDSGPGVVGDGLVDGYSGSGRGGLDVGGTPMSWYGEAGPDGVVEPVSGGGVPDGHVRVLEQFIGDLEALAGPSSGVVTPAVPGGSAVPAVPLAGENTHQAETGVVMGGNDGTPQERVFSPALDLLQQQWVSQFYFGGDGAEGVFLDAGLGAVSARVLLAGTADAGRVGASNVSDVDSGWAAGADDGIGIGNSFPSRGGDAPVDGAVGMVGGGGLIGLDVAVHPEMGEQPGLENGAWWWLGDRSAMFPPGDGGMQVEGGALFAGAVGSIEFPAQWEEVVALGGFPASGMDLFSPFAGHVGVSFPAMGELSGSEEVGRSGLEHSDGDVERAGLGERELRPVGGVPWTENEGNQDEGADEIGFGEVDLGELPLGLPGSSGVDSYGWVGTDVEIGGALLPWQGPGQGGELVDGGEVAEGDHLWVAAGGDVGFGSVVGWDGPEPLPSHVGFVIGETEVPVQVVPEVEGDEPDGVAGDARLESFDSAASSVRVIGPNARWVSSELPIPLANSVLYVGDGGELLVAEGTGRVLQMRGHGGLVRSGARRLTRDAATSLWDGYRMVAFESAKRYRLREGELGALVGEIAELAAERVVAGGDSRWLPLDVRMHVRGWSGLSLRDVVAVWGQAGMAMRAAFVSRGLDLAEAVVITVFPHYSQKGSRGVDFEVYEPLSAEYRAGESLRLPFVDSARGRWGLSGAERAELRLWFEWYVGRLTSAANHDRPRAVVHTRTRNESLDRRARSVGDLVWEAVESALVKVAAGPEWNVERVIRDYVQFYGGTIDGFAGVFLIAEENVDVRMESFDSAAPSARLIGPTVRSVPSQSRRSLARTVLYLGDGGEMLVAGEGGHVLPQAGGEELTWREIQRSVLAGRGRPVGVHRTVAFDSDPAYRLPEGELDALVGDVVELVVTRAAERGDVGWLPLDVRVHVRGWSDLSLRNVVALWGQMETVMRAAFVSRGLDMAREVAITILPYNGQRTGRPRRGVDIEVFELSPVEYRDGDPLLLPFLPGRIGLSGLARADLESWSVMFVGKLTSVVEPDGWNVVVHTRGTDERAGRAVADLVWKAVESALVKVAAGPEWTVERVVGRHVRHQVSVVESAFGVRLVESHDGWAASVGRAGGVGGPREVLSGRGREEFSDSGIGLTDAQGDGQRLETGLFGPAPFTSSEPRTRTADSAVPTQGGAQTWGARPDVVESSSREAVASHGPVLLGADGDAHAVVAARGGSGDSAAGRGAPSGAVPIVGRDGREVGAFYPESAWDREMVADGVVRVAEDFVSRVAVMGGDGFIPDAFGSMDGD
ncbi:hypothetical protein [Lentzea sp. NPDC004782]|uniref:hypothetical protein n=1 Tax=Lentzea sp. NPDC004782 TaxID=3154458 RepID=UPI0033AF9F0B